MNLPCHLHVSSQINISELGWHQFWFFKENPLENVQQQWARAFSKSGTGSVCLNYAAKLILVFAKHCNFLALSKHTVIMSALNMLLIFIAINVIKQNRYWFVMKLHLFSMLTTAND